MEPLGEKNLGAVEKADQHNTIVFVNHNCEYNVIVYTDTHHHGDS